MNNFANETIEIITAIQGYIDKHGNADIITCAIVALA